MGEDNGIVAKRRAYPIGGKQREVKGPYDITFRVQVTLEQLADEMTAAETAGDKAEERRITHAMLDAIFVEPFTDDEFLDTSPFRAAEYVADFFDDFEESSDRVATATLLRMKNTHNRLKSRQGSNATTRQQTR